MFRAAIMIRSLKPLTEKHITQFEQLNSVDKQMIKFENLPR